MNLLQKIEVANKILEKYNVEFRYACYDLSKSATAEIVVKDMHGSFSRGLIGLVNKSSIAKFYIGNFTICAESFEDSNKQRKRLQEFCTDIDILNALKLPYYKGD